MHPLFAEVPRAHPCLVTQILSPLNIVTQLPKQMPTRWPVALPRGLTALLTHLGQLAGCSPPRVVCLVLWQANIQMAPDTLPSWLSSPLLPLYRPCGHAEVFLGLDVEVFLNSDVGPCPLALPGGPACSTCCSQLLLTRAAWPGLCDSLVAGDAALFVGGPPCEFPFVDRSQALHQTFPLCFLLTCLGSISRTHSPPYHSSLSPWCENWGLAATCCAPPSPGRAYVHPWLPAKSAPLRGWFLCI